MIRSSLIRLMVSFSRGAALANPEAALFCCCRGGGQLLQHIDDARLLVRFQDVVKGFQLKGFHRMFFPRGDKDDKGLWANWLMFCASRTPSSDGILISRKMASTLLCWRNFSTSRPSSKLPTISIWLWVLISRGELLLGQKLILHNDNFHLFSAHDNSDSVSACGVELLGT